MQPWTWVEGVTEWRAEVQATLMVLFYIRKKQILDGIQDFQDI